MRTEAVNDHNLIENNCLEQLREFLQRYRLSQYYGVFVSEGFDRLLSLFDITESDLVSLNVKRGHRRLLQRAIATARGVPTSTPIIINYGYEEPALSQTPKPGTQPTMFFSRASDLNNQDNRRVRGHDTSQRKRKQHVPSKPVTAFDEFLNELKVEYQGMRLSDISFIAFERWSRLSGAEKEKYEREALHANSDYVMDLHSDKSPSRRTRYASSRYEPKQSTPDLEYNSSTSSRSAFLQNNSTHSISE